MNELLERQEKWERLFNYIMNKPYGETILHEEIVEIIKEPYNTNRYRSILAKTKKKLTESSKCLRSIKGQGYLIIEPDNYTDISLKYIKSGFKRVDKGYKILENAPINHMSKEALNTYREVNDRARQLQAKMFGGIQEIKMLSKKNRLVIRTN